jgi:hypothetical protein
MYGFSKHGVPHSVTHGGWRRFRRGLPASLTQVNEECLALQDSQYMGMQPMDEMVQVIKHAM